MKTTNRQLLEHQANCIETTLHHHNLPGCRVTGGVLAPRWARFNLIPDHGVRLAQVRALADDIARTLAARTCLISQDAGHIVIEIPRTDPQTVPLAALERNRQRHNLTLPPITATLGQQIDGVPLFVSLPSPRVAHILIAGTTGSGKSALLRTIILSLAQRHPPRQLGLVLIDPKRRQFRPLSALPHLIAPVLYEPDDAAEALAKLVALMLQRDRDDGSTPHIVIVIDELADLLQAAPQARAPLTRLAQRGREAGLHLVAATQKPTSAAITSLATANFPVRLIGQVTSPEEAKIASGHPQTGAHRLQGLGDFLAVSGAHTIHFQAAYISPPDAADLVAQLAAAHPPAAHLALPNTQYPIPNTQSPNTKIARHATLVRDLWPTLLKPDGSLKWGAKAAIARAIFDNPSTAGSYGLAVNAVIQHLRAESIPPVPPPPQPQPPLSGPQSPNSPPARRHAYTLTAIAPNQWRVVTTPPETRFLRKNLVSNASKTTTTTIRTLIHTLARLASRVRVVVVIIHTPGARRYRLTLPHLWGSSRLIIIHHQNGAYRAQRLSR